MKYFITGVPGTGKSTIGKLLENKGYKFIDSDHEPGLASWYEKETNKKVDSNPDADGEWFSKHDWNWDRKKIEEILNKYSKQGVFICGITSNQQSSFDLFDKIFLLKTNTEELRNRRKGRLGEGENDDEHDFYWHKGFEENLIKLGAISIDTNQEFNKIVEDIISSL